ncbi:cytochrome c [Shewanella avicenniae]|uniref:Cytochrome c n=1 Tax=Shewanella avicenniae TaxID=2814294 RepID=A0ABX7QRD4_9GAMM|nr:cytochrome c [Shewanella avicenniae]QSX33263.1 cytochrome c [Shewanella avicenniae]
MKKVSLVVFIVIIAAAVAWFSNRTPVSAFAGESLDAPAAELIQHGEYVARLSDCVACHTIPDKAPFSGGLKMMTPIGAVYSTNITPDNATGIGRYSLADFDRAVRHGVAQDGHRLYPAMPFPSYAKLTDDDVKALYAYFMHGVAPVAQPNHASDIPWPLNMRWPLALWAALFSDEGSYQPNSAENAQWNRGAYLVQGPGHCGSCHTPRGLAMQEQALDQSSKQYLAGALLDGWYAPSLRNDHNIGIGRWSEADVVQFLKNGRNQHAVVYGSMTDAYNNSTQFMSDEDLSAIAHYLKSLPGNPAVDGEPWRHQQQTFSANTANSQGAHIYLTRCAACHGADGIGREQWIPPLAGASSMLTRHDASAINITLNGSSRIVTQGVPDAYRMPPFRQQLSDQEIAAVLSFIRSAWGNQGAAVTADSVKTIRHDTDPASSDVVILQMR